MSAGELSVLHTADWHLGQSFFGYDRDFEHRSFLLWLVENVSQIRPDLIIVAGDVFDSANPSIQSQRRFYEFIAKLKQASPGTRLVVTAGNHDSATRLEAPAEILASLNTTIVGTVRWLDRSEIDYSKFVIPILNDQQQLQAVVLAVPFLRVNDVPFLPDAQDPYLDGVAEVYRLASELAESQRASQDVPLIAIGHCHVQGGTQSIDSERRIVIGGEEAIDARIFPPNLDYVALGHLHKSQQFQRGRIRYSGSPIPLSFTERSYENQILRLQFSGRRLMNCQSIKVPLTVPMLTIPKAQPSDLENAIREIAALPDCDQTHDQSSTPDQWPYLEVRLVASGPDVTRRKKIEDAVQGKAVRYASLKIETPSPQNVTGAQIPLNLEDLQKINPMDVFVHYYRQQYAEPGPDEDLMAALREIIDQAHKSL